MVEIAAESRITRVEVYARGAQVTRRAPLAAAPAGELEVVIPGLPVLAQPGSLRAQVDGGRQVVALRSSLVLPASPTTPGPALARVHELERRVERLSSEQQALATRRSALLGVTWHPAFDGRDQRLEPARRAADALAISGLCSGLAATLEPRLVLLDEELSQALRDLEAARLDASQATSSERAGAGHPTRELRVRLSGAGAGTDAAADLQLTFTYVVGAARWWPAYAARLGEGGARAELELAAFVAQASGEDWQGVELALSTADLVADVRLPELASLRLSRRQPPVKRGYRAPPPGLDAMFAAYERAVREAPPPPPPPPRPAPSRRPAPVTAGPPRRKVGAAPGAAPARRDEPMLERSRAPEAEAEMPSMESVVADFTPPPSPQPMRSRAAPPPPGAAPMMMQSFGAAPGAPSAPLGGGGAGAAPAAIAFGVAAPASIEPTDAWLDFDGLELASGDDGSARGRLRRAGAPSEGSARVQATQAIEALAAPARTVDPRAARGMFDHRYEAGAALDVPSDARAHRVPLQRAAAPARPRFVTVPREAAEVYREVALDNPFAAPLLPGPCEVFVEGALLTTTSLGEVGKGGTIALGLGVEERLRVARNARVDEQSAGLLGGSTTVDHRVTIDLRSSLGRAVTVEVIDRVPVTDDDDIEITQNSKPPPERYEQIERGQPVRGGLRWRVPLPAGGKATIEHGYRVKLSAKHELAGGNRRE